MPEESEQTTLERLSCIFIESYEVPASVITPLAHLVDDLGLDSLDVADMAVEIDLEFDVELDDDQLEACNTVADVVNAIDAKLPRESL